MVYVSDLQQLVASWIDRLKTVSYPQSYTDAMNDCIYDLTKVIDKSIEEELDYKDFLESLEADSYLSSMEAHEHAA